MRHGIQNNIMWDVVSPQPNCWRLQSSGMQHYITGPVFCPMFWRNIMTSLASSSTSFKDQPTCSSLLPSSILDWPHTRPSNWTTTPPSSITTTSGSPFPLSLLHPEHPHLCNTLHLSTWLFFTNRLLRKKALQSFEKLGNTCPVT